MKELGKASGIRKHMRRLAFSIVDCMEHATEMRGSSKRISKVILSMQSFGLQQSISGDGYSQPLQERREMQKTFSNDNENNLVGLEQNVKTLVHYFVEEDCIRVISITTMGGIGKTTIARQVFNHETVKNHFEGLAWVCVSQQFTRKDVWRTILRNLQPNYEEITEDEIQNKLFGLMETQNYLIVHDDIWKEEDWDRIKPFFFIKLGVSQTYGRTQTNLQVEVQPTDRPSLRVRTHNLVHEEVRPYHYHWAMMFRTIKPIFPQKKDQKVILTSRNEDVAIRADPTRLDDIKFKLYGLQLLRVLDLSRAKFEEGKLPSNIGKLTHLRYLSLYHAWVSDLPYTIQNLKLLLYLNFISKWGISCLCAQCL
ncbi:hypothetical protein F2Q69_00013182 [Brassica cretica]|uniref:NB-ARC domain-containing protein n=1 Tax=Brassica cretica TaxID=69181 RepID=A0A8S9QLL4_BRACR|nr:hypothetical protein F2Q69_00013182 [Brassica cretica]